MGIPGPNDPDSAFPTTGGVAVGNVCWFEAAGAPFTPAPTVFPEWQAFDDGVPVGTDARVSPGDAALIEVLTAGTYMLTVETVCGTAVATPVNMSLDLNINQGPLYALSSHLQMPGDGANATLRICCPVKLAVGDVIKVTVTGGAEDVTVTGGMFVLVGLTTPA